MATYRKRGKTWQFEISYKRDDGKYDKIRQGGFPLKADAIAEAAEIEAKMSKGLKFSTKDILLSAHFKQWMEVYKKDKVTPITYKKYENTLMNIEKYFKNDTVKKLNRTSYQKVINLYAETHANETVERLNIHIRSSLRNLIDESVIPYDFTKGAVIKGQSPSKKESDKFLNYDEFKSLMNLAKENLNPKYASRFMIVIAGATGMRFSELLGLTWDRVDLNLGIITIDRTWDYQHGNTFAPTKNEQSVRNVYIDDETVRVMTDFKIKQEKLFNDFKINPEHPFVFYNATNGIISNHSVNNKLKKLCHQLNIDTPITIHGLRHTNASILIFKGVNILAVSKHLGHKNLTITMNTYAHAIKELEDRESENIKKVFDEIYN